MIDKYGRCNCGDKHSYCTDTRFRCGLRRRNLKCSICGAKWATIELPVMANQKSTNLKLVEAKKIIMTTLVDV